MLLAAAPRASAEPKPLLAGVLPATERLGARWPRSGAWLYPVGDSLDLSLPVGSTPGYRVNRGVLPHTREAAGHDGADISNGCAGGRVRAAAHGVVAVAHADTGVDYGIHVVLVHRLEDGRLAYTVYAHLEEGSLRVTAGRAVRAGQRLGRVGATGRATMPHLHFEVRIPTDSTLRWENCPVVDPVGFVRDRLPSPRADTAWTTPYLMWAELAGIVPRGLAAEDAVDAPLLARMVQRAAPRSAHAAPRDSAHADTTAASPTDWDDVARELSWLRRHLGALPECPVGVAWHERCYALQLGVRRPARDPNRLARLGRPPRVGQVCLALADLVVPRPTQAAKASPRPKQ